MRSIVHFVLALASPGLVSAGDPDVIYIEPQDGVQRGQGIIIMGSDSCLLLTASHVLGSAESAYARGALGRRVRANVQVNDPTLDVALLEPEDPIEDCQRVENSVTVSNAISETTLFLLTRTPAGDLRRIELRPVESNDRQIVLVVRDPRDRVTAGMSGAPIMMGGGRVVGILLQGTGDRIDKSRLIAVRSDYIGRVLGGRIPMAPIRAVAVSAVAIGENSTASMDLPEPTPEETRAPARTIDPNAAIDSDLADSEAPTAESLANEALSKIPLGGFEWPVEGKVVRKFGPGPSGERNDGIKIAVAVNTPVVASADGVVAYVGGDVPALGLIVILSHGNGFTTVYGQLGRLVVARGQSVKKGQTLGLSGRSPLSDAAQIHFETRSGRTPVDPMRVLDAKGGVK